MRKFLKNTKGAVTVFVTLLLIPAMLISGTAVDLARLHTARSILQDANQLAANSVLSQYNALLQNLYGLYGVAETDPILAELLDEYIKVSVFGEERQDKSTGTLQVFYGSDITMSEPEFTDNMNLGETAVLRRQIEEYMKLRGPVTIVKDIIEALTESRIKEDAELLDKKTEIDSTISDAYNKYKELYNAIVAADKCISPIGGISGGNFGNMGQRLKEIYDQFVDLYNCHTEWETAVKKMKAIEEANEENEEYDDKTAKEYEGLLEIKNDQAARYDAILTNIVSLTVTGPRGSNWNKGRWSSTGNINASIESLKAGAKSQGDLFKVKFDTVVKIAKEIDEMHADLKVKIEEFERKLEEKECSDEIYAALTVPAEGSSKSILDMYKDMLRWSNIEKLATPYKNEGYNYIDNIFKPSIDHLRFGSVTRPDSEGLSLDELASVSSGSAFSLSESGSASGSREAVIAAFRRDEVSHKMPPGFKKFWEISHENKVFFEELSILMYQPNIPPVKLYDNQEEGSGSDAEEKQRSLINDLLDFIDEAYAGLLNDQLGAKYISDRETPVKERLGLRKPSSLISESARMPVLGIFTNPLKLLGEAGDYILLLSYSTSMFSNYTTGRPEGNGKTRENMHEIDFPKSLAGVPLSPEVNYFFQSELEYLYSGHENAAKNLNTVTRLIFMLRMVCNYITVFFVRDVTRIIDGIYKAFKWSLPLSIVLAELARLAFVAAESLYDVATLRTGSKVPLFKSPNDWTCSPKGIQKALKEIKASNKEPDGMPKKEKGLAYHNYMLLFFLAKVLSPSVNAGNELAVRTGKLIEWNVINYRNNINSDESKMIEVLKNEDRFRLSGMKTDFSITTNAELRMLFFSMIFAQNFSNSRGIGMPSSFPVTVTDHRGY